MCISSLKRLKSHCGRKALQRSDLLYCSKSVLLQHFPSSQPPSQILAFALRAL